jgi:acyl-CoA dehydrogenase
MAITDIEVGLSDEQRAIRDNARKFADEVLRPAGIALDRLSDPAQVIAPESALWRVFEKSRELGLDQLESSGGDLSPVEAARVRYLVNEELGRGDSGLAISLGVAGFHGIFARMSGRPALVERFCGESSREIGCWAVTGRPAATPWRSARLFP